VRERERFGPIRCRLSGDSDPKSHIAVGERRFASGRGFRVRMKSGNSS